MSIKMFGIANCDTIKKSKKFLDNKKISYEFIDFKKTPPSEKQIQSWLKFFGSEQVINKRGATWRKLDQKQQALAVGSLEQQAKLLSEHPSMIKRPIIESSKVKLIGFNENDFNQLK